jgi:uncharacterized protein YjbJ (UPF0337 family)
MTDAAGRVTGTDKLRAEGAIDKAKGELRDGLGNAKDAIRKVDKDSKN